MKTRIVNYRLLLSIMALMQILASSSVFGQENVDGIYYRVVGENEVIVVNDDRNNSYEGTVIIPERISLYEKWYDVVAIEAYAFSHCYNLQKVTIPNSVQEIGEDAFNMCINLEEITLPSQFNSSVKFSYLLGNQLIINWIV